MSEEKKQDKIKYNNKWYSINDKAPVDLSTIKYHTRSGRYVTTPPYVFDKKCESVHFGRFYKNKVWDFNSNTIICTSDFIGRWAYLDLRGEDE